MATRKFFQDARPVDSRPTIAELQGDNYFAQLAKKNWLKDSGPSRFNPELLKSSVWDILEKDNFQFRSLLVLENLRFLEKYASYLDHRPVTDLLAAIYGLIILKNPPITTFY